MEIQLGKMKIKRIESGGKVWWRIRVNGREYYTDMEFVKDIVHAISKYEAFKNKEGSHV